MFTLNIFQKSFLQLVAFKVCIGLPSKYRKNKKSCKKR